MTIAIRDAFIKISTSPWTPLLKDHAFLSDTSDEMPHIELKKGLRLTHPIPKSYNVKGYCMGGALTLISCYLHRQAPLDIKQLHHDYRIAIKSVILVQKLQEQLLGAGNTCPQKITNYFAELLIQWHQTGVLPPYSDTIGSSQTKKIEMVHTALSQYLNTNSTCNLRKFIIEFLENHQIKITPSLYTLTLEVCGFHDKLLNPKAHRFHRLQKDTLYALANLCAINVTEIFADFGTKKTAIDTLQNVPIGIYHISLARHSCVYIKENEEFSWFWDVNSGFKKIKSSPKSKYKLEKLLPLWYTTKANWITISQFSYKGQ